MLSLYVCLSACLSVRHCSLLLFVISVVCFSSFYYFVSALVMQNTFCTKFFVYMSVYICPAHECSFLVTVT